ncbi:hypothetical protein T492DRAFT_834500 [Pavlovales sp. CCMP2436]|nr:hypothetical protein T492DRAFT_834500 [Pavlovales sp. CCMP2436]
MYSESVHYRKLAAAIGSEPLSQGSRQWIVRSKTVRFYRHVAAQHAGRASVNIITMFFFRERKEPVRGEGLRKEDAPLLLKRGRGGVLKVGGVQSIDKRRYIIGLREKGAIVLVARYGIKGHGAGTALPNRGWLDLVHA